MKRNLNPRLESLIKCADSIASQNEDTVIVLKDAKEDYGFFSST